MVYVFVATALAEEKVKLGPRTSYYITRMCDSAAQEFVLWIRHKLLTSMMVNVSYCYDVDAIAAHISITQLQSLPFCSENLGRGLPPIARLKETRLFCNSQTGFHFFQILKASVTGASPQVFGRLPCRCRHWFWFLLETSVLIKMHCAWLCLLSTVGVLAAGAAALQCPFELFLVSLIKLNLQFQS